MKDVKTTPISQEDYLRKKISKDNRLQTDDKLNELADHSTLLIQHEHFSNMEKEGEDISKKSIQHPNHTNTDQSKENQHFKKQAHNQETFTMMRSGWIIMMLDVYINSPEKVCCYQDTVMSINCTCLHQHTVHPVSTEDKL